MPREVFEARLQIHIERIKDVEKDVLAIQTSRRYQVTTWLAGFGALGTVAGVVAALVTH